MQASVLLHFFGDRLNSIMVDRSERKRRLL